MDCQNEKEESIMDERAESAKLAPQFTLGESSRCKVKDPKKHYFGDYEDLVKQKTRQKTKSHEDIAVQKSRKKTEGDNRARQVGGRSLDPEASALEDSAGSEDDEETKPGAVAILGPTQGGVQVQIEASNAQTEQTSVFVGDTNAAMIVEADLAPELMTANEVRVQEDDAMIIKKKQHQRILLSAMLFYGFAIICNISSFVLLFVNPPPAHGRLYSPLYIGLVPAAFFLVIAAILILLPTRRCCSSIRLEDYAPDDRRLLREAQIASAASLCLFLLVAIPIIVLSPNLQWLGYAFMTLVFAGTVFAFLCVRTLRRSRETRQEKSKAFWVLFVVLFLALCGATVWRCLNPVYPDCIVDYASWIGDGLCDGPFYNTMECGYDGGDCLEFNDKFPGCFVEFPWALGDQMCDPEPYNTKACGYDGGDCDATNSKYYPDCHVDNPSRIGDGLCDGRQYGMEECGFDGGDCLKVGERCRGHRECASEICNNVTKVCDSGFVSEQYPNCFVDMPGWIGDGECDGGYYAREACGFDGGDCLRLGEPCLQDEQCASGFCNVATKVCYLGVLEEYPGCFVEYPRKIGDGECNFGLYSTEECGYDGGDCLA